MAKTYHDLISDVREWSVSTSHAAHVTDRMSVQTNKSAKAKRPNVVQLRKLPFSKKERQRRGIHGFTLNDPNTL